MFFRKQKAPSASVERAFCYDRSVIGSLNIITLEVTFFERIKLNEASVVLYVATSESSWSVSAIWARAFNKECWRSTIPNVPQVSSVFFK